jgi:hypothetical protein
MRRISLVILAALTVLVAAAPARARPGVQITDPSGDGNFVNDHGHSSVHDSDNNAMHPDLSDDGDILAVAFSNTPKTVTVHVQVEHDPTATAGGQHGPGLMFEIVASPPSGEAAEAGCLRWTAVLATSHHPTYTGTSQGSVADRCAGDGAAQANVRVVQLPDATAVVEITAPRDVSPLLAPGKSLTRPWASTHAVAGADPSSPAWFDRLLIDTTVVGRDYRLRR